MQELLILGREILDETGGSIQIKESVSSNEQE